jgi:hypothetical protein
MDTLGQSFPEPGVQSNLGDLGQTTMNVNMNDDFGLDNYYSFLDQDLKLDPAALASFTSSASSAGNFDFFGGLDGGNGGSSSISFDSIMPTISEESPAQSQSQDMSIDPQLMDAIAPSALDHASVEDADGDKENAQESKSSDKDKDGKEKITLVIQPVKVGGRGKAARKGTVQAGGVVKKTSSTPIIPTSTSSIPTSNLAMPYGLPSTSLLFSSLNTTGLSLIDKENTAFNGTLPPLPVLPPLPKSSVTKSKSGGSDAGKEEEDDDDLPLDWRPPPEVIAKMTSKEKRQLRNKISARNFRVRRKGSCFFFVLVLGLEFFAFCFSLFDEWCLGGV